MGGFFCDVDCDVAVRFVAFCDVFPDSLLVTATAKH
jgi:hypothetical protein